MRKPSSTNSQNRNALVRCCILNDVLERVALRWKMPVLNKLAGGVSRYRELRQALPEVSDQMLAKRLRELVDERLVIKVRCDAPGALHAYEVTAAGHEMIAIMDQICAWGQRHAWPEALDAHVRAAM